MFSKGTSMEGERIEAVKDWPEPKPLRGMKVSLCFASFYQRSTQGFSRIAAPLTLMPKANESSEVSISRVLGVDNDEVDGVGSRGGEPPYC